MIDPDEIVNMSEELRVHTSHVQRDYIFGWLLSGIFTQSELAEVLVLKGGNCFRKVYFRRARYSNDLDFAAERQLTDEYLLAHINSVCDFVSANTGVEFDTDRTRIDPTPSAVRGRSIQKGRVYFKDFFGEESQIVISVRLDISSFERIFLDIQERDLIHQYSDASQAASTVRCLKLEELLASKLKCLLQRRHSADLYDFVNATLIRPVIDIDRAEMIQTFLQMTIFSAGPRIVENLLLNLPFQLIKGLWNEYLDTPSDAHIDFDDAVGQFKAIVTQLFGELPAGSSGYAFFPADLRNPILQAGHDLTLLRIRYNGVERMTEPYSLKYKRRQDGVGREYLYVYDRTGGTSGPGIKSLVYDGVDSITTTDIEFEPRFEVELSKAGQLFGDTYFRGSPGPRFTSRTSSAKYVVLCTSCGKRFKRKRYSTKLNKHKDKYGQPCYGRIGAMV